MSTNNALGDAKDFSIFIFNNHTQSSVDCEGAVAVGNKATYVNLSLGSFLATSEGISTSKNDLVVGNFVDITGGTNFSGNSILQTIDDSAIISYTMTNNNVTPPQPNLMQLNCPVDDNCIDFTANQSNLISLANNIANYTDPVGESHIGTVEVLNPYYLQLQLTGNNNDYNVFFIDYGQLLLDYPLINSFNQFIINAPDDSSVIIVANYETTSPSVRNIDFKNGNIVWNNYTLGNDHNSLNNTTKNQHLFWCFPDCTDLNISNYQFAGTILAPIANSIVSQGQVNGSIISENLTGSGEVHYYLYQGTLPITSDKASISGVMWDNFENDGVLYPTSGLVPYAPVQLLDENGNVVATTLTDTNGYYQFTNLDPGTYRVQFIIPETHNNYSFVTAGNWVDSNGLSPSYTLNAGDNQENVNAPIHVGDFEIHKSVCAKNIISFDKGNIIYYEIFFINYSDNAINNLLITDTLSSNTSYNNDAKIYIGPTEMTNIPGYFNVSISGSTLNFNILYLPANIAGYILFSVSLTEDYIPGNSIINSATAIFNETEVKSEETVVRYETISINKYAPSNALSGSEITYTLAIANSSAITNIITVTDNLPPEFTLNGYTGGTQDVSSLISIRSGCLVYPTDPDSIPTLTNPDGGVEVTDFTATLDPNNTLTITNLSIKGSSYLDSSTIACLSGLLISITGSVAI